MGIHVGHESIYFDVFTVNKVNIFLRKPINSTYLHVVSNSKTNILIPPSQKSTLKMLILPTPYENRMHHNG